MGNSYHYSILERTYSGKLLEADELSEEFYFGNSYFILSLCRALGYELPVHENKMGRYRLMSHEVFKELLRRCRAVRSVARIYKYNDCVYPFFKGVRRDEAGAYNALRYWLPLDRDEERDPYDTSFFSDLHATLEIFENISDDDFDEKYTYLAIAIE